MKTTYEYPFKTHPYKHQLDCWRASKATKVFALLMEMGCGKSKVIIDTIAYLYDLGLIDSAVIYAPKGVIRNWQDQEIPIHMPEHVRYRLACWAAVPNREDKRAMELLAQRDSMNYLRILLVNVESMSSKRAFEHVEHFMLGAKPLLAIDESTSIKHESAKRTKALLYLARFAEYRRIMSGDPAANSPFDLYAQFAFLDPHMLGFSSFYSFKNHFGKCVGPNDVKRLEKIPGWRGKSSKELESFGFDADIIAAVRRGAGRNYTAVLEYRNTDELAKLIAPHSFIVKKEDCLDLPPKIYETRAVEMNDEQERAYAQMKRECVVEIEKSLKGKQLKLAPPVEVKQLSFDELQACQGVEFGWCDCAAENRTLSPVCPVCNRATRASRDEKMATASIVITQLLRLHQIVCGFVTTDEKEEIDLGATNPRIEELVELLENHNGKAIVWANYRRSIKHIEKALADKFGPESVVTYYGATKDAARRQAIKSFQDPASPVKYFVSNRSGAFGLTLTQAGLVVYFSNDYDREVRGQSEDRAHRIGQTKSVLYVDLVCNGTVDEKIIKALKEKKALSEIVTASNWKEWFI